MSKPLSSCKEPSKENSLIASSNQASLPPHLPPQLDPYVDVVLQANQDTNLTPPPPSPTRERLVDEINQLQDLSNLLAMHLTTPSTPYSPHFSHTLNLDQVEHHFGYCLCCRYNRT
ncbi:hypothetical protein Tco_1232146 [Tanacetum coccineum]